jgi:hypothetical protein
VEGTVREVPSIYPAARPKKNATGIKSAEKEEPRRLARLLELLMGGLYADWHGRWIYFKMP